MKKIAHFNSALIISLIGLLFVAISSLASSISAGTSPWTQRKDSLGVLQRIARVGSSRTAYVEHSAVVDSASLPSRLVTAVAQSIASDSTNLLAQTKPYIDARRYGVTGNGVTDDTAAFQAACNAAFADQTHPLPLWIHGTVRITSTVQCGVANTKTTGWILEGDAGKSSEIVYSGSTTGGALWLRNLQFSVVKNIRIRDTHFINGVGQSAFGLWLDADNTASGGHDLFINIDVSGFQDGIRIGHLPVGDVNDLADDTWIRVGGDSSKFGFHIIGANTDGQFIDDYTGAGDAYAIRCESCRNLHVDGIEYSNLNTAQGDNFIFLWADGGDLGGGGYSIKNARIEQGTALAWFGQQNGLNDSKLVNLEIDNVTEASTHTYAAPSTRGTITATAGTSGSLPTGTYYFRVSALDGGFGETLPSSEVSAAVTGPNGSVALSWAPAAGPSYYKVYYGTTPNAESRFIYSWTNSARVTLGPDAALAGRPLSFATVGTRAIMLHFGEDGNVQVENSSFPQPGSFFQMGGLASNTWTSLELLSNQIDNSNPERIGSLVDAVGQGGGGTTGGMMYRASDNIIINSLFLPTGYVHNRWVRFTSTDAINERQSVLLDCDASLRDGCATEGAIK